MQSSRLQVNRAVGARVSHIRKLRGLTQKQVAEALGETPVTQSRYERGTRGIPLFRLVELAIILQVTPAIFLLSEEPYEYLVSVSVFPAKKPDLSSESTLLRRSDD